MKEEMAVDTIKRWNLLKVAVLVLATSLAVTADLGGAGPSPALAERQECWMTGGGSVFNEVDNHEVQWAGAFDGSGRVTHGFVLRCDRQNPNSLEINFGGNRFHLETLDFSVCSDDPNIEPNPPGATFDTFTGIGTGRFNGVRGATAVWTFTDAGEGGSNDFASIQITDADGNLVLSVSGFLTFGNHQAHSQ